MNPDHTYTLHLHDDFNLAVDAGCHTRSPGGWVDIGPVMIYADDMAVLADTLERASRLARSVSADQQYEQGGVES